MRNKNAQKQLPLPQVEMDQFEDLIWSRLRRTILGLRLKNNLSLNELRKLLGHSSLTTLSRFERGEGKIKLSELFILCSHFDIDIKTILPTQNECNAIIGKENFSNNQYSDTSELMDIAHRWQKGNEKLMEITKIVRQREDKK